jgi:ABC-type glycerol-3-phosphate transport system permease component
MVTIKGITKNFNPPVEFNFAPSIIQSIIEFILCVIVFVSAAYVLKFRKVWKQILIYSLIASIIFLLVFPIVNYYNPTFLIIDSVSGPEKEMLNAMNGSLLMWSYTWSVIISAFFIYTIIKLSKEEIKLLFK